MPSRFTKWLLLAFSFPIITNAFIVAWELTFFDEPYWFSVLTVGLVELTVMVAAYIIFMILKRNKGFFKVIKADQNLDFKI